MKDNYQKIRLIERCLFIALLMGLGTAGALYESLQETVKADLLLPLLVAFMALCYAIYRGSLWLVVRFLAPRD